MEELDIGLSNFFSPQCFPWLEYTVWCIFAKTCRILCEQFHFVEENSQADDFLVTYGKKFEELYGKQVCVPNMHITLHIVDWIHNNGPIYFGFGSSYSNIWLVGIYTVKNTIQFLQKHHSIPVQLMNKFIAEKESLHNRRIKRRSNKWYFLTFKNEKVQPSLQSKWHNMGPRHLYEICCS